MAFDHLIRKHVKEKLGDIEWRLDNLYFIKDKYGKTIKFKRNESQLWLWRNRHYLNIILKDRQRGFSTFIAILILDTCLFNSNHDCGIVDLTIVDAEKKLAKIKFAYNRLPAWIKAHVALTTDAKRELVFENGSSVYAATSHRGGTLQVLHISEMGKVSCRWPERAREIRTGALNTIAPGCWIFNESTAEGEAGEFYDDCQAAQAMNRSGDRLTPLDYKFHFFGWWMDGNANELDPAGVTITPKLLEYFDTIEKQFGVTINDRKRAWYAKKSQQQKGDMHREFPGTPEEAFRATIEGAYLARQMEELEFRGQIGRVPYDPSAPVNTGWDFGLRDRMTIWLHQVVGLQHCIIGYISGTDEDVLFYWRRLQSLPYIYGRHFLPHDGDQRRIGTARSFESKPRRIRDILADAGMRHIEIVPRVQEKYTAIQEVRQFLPKCWFDEDGCRDLTEDEKLSGQYSPGQDGIRCLKNYRREWDDKLGTWKNTPRHDWASHGYDGFETLARGIGLFGEIEIVPPEIRQPGTEHLYDKNSSLPPPPDWRVM